MIHNPLEAQQQHDFVSFCEQNILSNNSILISISAVAELPKDTITIVSLVPIHLFARGFYPLFFPSSQQALISYSYMPGMQGCINPQRLLLWAETISFFVGSNAQQNDVLSTQKLVVHECSNEEGKAVT